MRQLRVPRSELMPSSTLRIVTPRLYLFPLFYVGRQGCIRLFCKRIVDLGLKSFHSILVMNVWSAVKLMIFSRNTKSQNYYSVSWDACPIYHYFVVHTCVLFKFLHPFCGWPIFYFAAIKNPKESLLSVFPKTSQTPSWAFVSAPPLWKPFEGRWHCFHPEWQFTTLDTWFPISIKMG